MVVAWWPVSGFGSCCGFLGGSWRFLCGCRGMVVRLVFGGGGMVARLVFVVTGVWIGAMI